MSVINDALRRLDRQHSGRARPLPSAPGLSPRTRSRLLLPFLLGCGLLLSAGGYLLLNREAPQVAGSVAVAPLAQARAATGEPESVAEAKTAVDGSGSQQRRNLALPLLAVANEAVDGYPINPQPSESSATLASEAQQLQAVTAAEPDQEKQGRLAVENPSVLTSTEPGAPARNESDAAMGDEAVSDLTRAEQGMPGRPRERVEQLTSPRGSAPSAQSLAAPDVASESPALLTAPTIEATPSAPPVEPAAPAAPEKPPRASSAGFVAPRAAGDAAASDVMVEELRRMLAAARYSEGAVVAKQALEQGESGQVRALLVEFAARAGDYAGAMAAARSLGPEHRSANTRFWIGYSRLQLGEAAAAAQEFGAALLRDAENPQLWFYQGLALQESGRHGQAIDAFHRARELAPDLPEIAYNTGLSWWALGERERARAAFRHFMSVTAAAPQRYAAQRERLLTGYLSR
ncbi:MAG: tetratricopeptide repeat protein [Pseudomonadota bacterium]|nr:tetratricopeptide repeat protein [Pseudomonadota bacterium]